MSRYKPLSCQTTKHFVVIRKNRAYPLHVIKEWLDNNYKQYALIVHDKDIDPITKQVIPVHYHYVGIALKNKTPMSTFLNDLSKTLKTDNVGIEFDSFAFLEKALQYLIHRNNPEKTQHEIKEVIYSGWSKEEIDTFITCDCTGINFDRVYSLCLAYTSIIDIIRELGLANYHKYRSTIQDIFYEVNPRVIRNNIPLRK